MVAISVARDVARPNDIAFIVLLMSIVSVQAEDEWRGRHHTI